MTTGSIGKTVDSKSDRSKRHPDKAGCGDCEPAHDPLQDKALPDNGTYGSDAGGVGTLKPDIAPSVGYTEDGPPGLGGPVGDRKSTRWQGSIPVYQWEIDPNNSSLEYEEREIARDGWEFRIWWQVHPADLVYVSVSVIADDKKDERPLARQHPIGNNVVVNLVYDQRRRGVVAIYGTALDFRPFVEVFFEAFNSQKLDSASEPSLAKEKQS